MDAAIAANRVRGLSDRAIAWLFISSDDPAFAGDQYLSADLGHSAVVHEFQVEHTERCRRFVGIDNYVDILTDEDIWHGMQVTARFVF